MDRLDPTARAYFTAQVTRNGTTHEGIAVDKNVYRLFIFRALDHWCRQASSAGDSHGGRRPGRVGFVIPLAFCASNDAADLRRLFAPGGRWTIREIVDMELIWQDVFDADVLPMILIAEAREPREDDQVRIRLADARCVVRDPRRRRARASFDLPAAPEAEIPYADLFTPEGRIATRLTPERLEIVRKLRALDKLSSAAKRYWTRRRGGRAVTDERPTSIGEADWIERRMITDGVARRRTGTEGSEGGLDLYKGENIRTGGFAGEPIFRAMDVWNLSTPSVWGFREILPCRMWALPIIAQVPCAAPFNPAEVAVLNTVTVFGPRDDLLDFPFDLALTSRTYGWYTLLSLRSSYQNMLRGHLYPSTIAQLPWSERLSAEAANLEAMREAFFTACRRRFEAEAELRRQAEELGLRPLREVFRHLSPEDASLEYSEHFDSDENLQVSLGQTAAEEAQEDSATLMISDQGHTLTLPTPELAQIVWSGLRLLEGQEIDKAALLRLPVPPDVDVAAELDELAAGFGTEALESVVFERVDEIDDIVGTALGLTADEIAFIQEEVRDDPFLSRIRPRYPYFTPALRGRRHNLERSHRYGDAAEAAE